MKTTALFTALVDKYHGKTAHKAYAPLLVTKAVTLSKKLGVLHTARLIKYGMSPAYTGYLIYKAGT